MAEVDELITDHGQKLLILADQQKSNFTGVKEELAEI
jgi:hypothetical protein